MVEQLDVAHAAMVEPFTHGSWSSVDQILDVFDEAIVESKPDRETFGTTAGAQRGAARAEGLFGQARPAAKKPPRPRKPPPAFGAVGSGHPMEPGLVEAVARAVIRARVASTLPPE